MKNLNELSVQEMCTMEMTEIDGGKTDVLFWVGLALSCVPGGTLAGQLIAVAGASSGESSEHNYSRLY